MRKLPRHLFRILVFSLLAFAGIPSIGHATDLERHLRDEYQGKILVLRGFQANDVVRYDSTGLPSSPNSGEWTTDGFVRVNDIHLSDDRLIIKAQRMAVIWPGTRQFELRPLGRDRDKGKKGTRVEIDADPGTHNPSAERIDAVLSKIFLTAQDDLASSVPDYWKPCVPDGLAGKDANCYFSPEFLAIPGVLPSAGSSATTEVTSASGPDRSKSVTFRVGSGVSPPRVIFQRDPVFSEPARQAKFQGAVTLMLVVNKEGLPTKIHVVKPLGCGLDAKAVQAVETWRFAPSQKDGQPVAVEIAVQVEFHLY